MPQACCDGGGCGLARPHLCATFAGRRKEQAIRAKVIRPRSGEILPPNARIGRRPPMARLWSRREDGLSPLAQSRRAGAIGGTGRVRWTKTLRSKSSPATHIQGHVDLKSGAMYFSRRDRPREFEVKLPKRGCSRGDGKFWGHRNLGPASDPGVRRRGGLSTAFGGTVPVFASEQGVVDPSPPAQTAVIDSRGVQLQWLALLRGGSC